MQLGYTIDLVLKRFYEKHEILTSITRNKIREILLFCKKNVHFTFRDFAYLQTFGIAMGSPLGPVLAGIFMVHCQKYLIPLPTVELSFQKRYLDESITFVKIGRVDHILSMINNFHPNIQFTYETKYNFKLAVMLISFLDVMLCRDGENTVTTVYRKVSNADVYLDWISSAPHSWKRGTLKTLSQRAYMIFSTTKLLHTELKYLEKVFVEKKNYPKWVIRQVFTQVKFINDSNLSPPTI